MMKVLEIGLSCIKGIYKLYSLNFIIRGKGCYTKVLFYHFSNVYNMDF